MKKVSEREREIKPAQMRSAVQNFELCPRSIQQNVHREGHACKRYSHYCGCLSMTY